MWSLRNVGNQKGLATPPWRRNSFGRRRMNTCRLQAGCLSNDVSCFLACGWGANMSMTFHDKITQDIETTYFEFPPEMFSLSLGQASTGQPAKIKKLQRCKARFVRSNRRKIQQIGKRLKVPDFGLSFLNISSISLIQKLNDESFPPYPKKKVQKAFFCESWVDFCAFASISANFTWKIPRPYFKCL